MGLREKTPRPLNYITRFIELEENTGIHLVDVLPYFRRLSRQEIDNSFLSGDCRYSSFTHRVLARALLAELRQIGLLS